MFLWLSVASLAAIIVLTVGETYYGNCTVHLVSKRLFLQRPNSNDNCTFEYVFLQCRGFCETEAKANSKNVIRNAKGSYDLVPEAKCECCQPDPSNLSRIYFPPGHFKCQENPELTWDKEVPFDYFQRCNCLPCKSSDVL